MTSWEFWETSKILTFLLKQYIIKVEKFENEDIKLRPL